MIPLKEMLRDLLGLPQTNTNAGPPSEAKVQAEQKQTTFEEAKRKVAEHQSYGTSMSGSMQHFTSSPRLPEGAYTCLALLLDDLTQEIRRTKITPRFDFTGRKSFPKFVRCKDDVYEFKGIHYRHEASSYVLYISISAFDVEENKCEDLITMM